ncbi:sugar phosphate isomerase/epimerase family protein [Paenibacillus lignilyticus]|uniref:Sugar phosphate isomerase/epimerase n=1 Tax=Paenibacillus lignilyticus TaxID=1172615 RepID=A0ABS5CN29_9BACL|nr:sugar phosphate isomerase/epimerase family protein [Paenibacillus lignilyticus]MBP3967268.1 sugar phosphate isomerase/epimerase [Paenibacillus lignilyticus]
MKIAISVWSCHKYLYDGSWQNADFIDYAASVGAQGVELLSVFWNKESDVPAVHEALARTGIKLACFGACNDFVKTTAEEREVQLQDIILAVDMAVEFGAEVVRVFAGDRKEGISYEQAKGWIVEGLAKGAAYAESKGVVLCLENHGIFAGKSEQVQDIITLVGSPALRSTFDMGNFLLVDDVPAQAFEALHPLIRHVHAKDFLRVGEDQKEGVLRALSGQPFIGAVPTEGDVGVASIVGKLAGVGYDGWMSIEYEGLEEQKSGTARAVEKLAEAVEAASVK